MPRKDPVEKLAYQNAWRKQAMKNGYGKYLWRKRKCLLTDAAEFRKALESIMDVGDRTAVQVARKALRQSAKRWEGVGPPETHVNGGKTVFDVRPQDDTLFEALTKLGLS